MIDAEDLLWFVELALDGLVAAVEQLGDELVNVSPDLPGANTAFGLVTHCLGVMEFWAGHVVAGRPSNRDRAAEFRATGVVADLLRRVEAARAQLRVDVLAAAPAQPPRCSPGRDDDDLPLGRTQGGALLHVHEELAQHLGQLEVIRDVVLRARHDEAAAPG